MRRTIFLFVLVPVISLIAASVVLAVTERFGARLTGAQEVPPVSTEAQGTARFTKVSNTKMTYTLTASNIDKVSDAHIHRAPRGKDGDIVVDLRVPETCTVQATSISCQGSFTRARLSGPLAGRSLSVLVQAMKNGNTYVNVHTTDFPGGEIRGQIRPL